MSTNPSALGGPIRAGTVVRDALLQQRFISLWRRSLLPEAHNDAGQVWRSLAHRYAEPHRHYHDKHHLAHCLEQLDLAGDAIGHPGRVEMAIWFHDVINEPGRRDNEQRSAEFFSHKAAGVMDPAFVAAVIDLILVTTHAEHPDDLDHQFICDIDLASFGCPWECFLKDSDAVKAEFPGPEADYYAGKRSFLEAMLSRPKIFLTDFFNQRYEQQARDNIRRLLDLIDQQAH